MNPYFSIFKMRNEDGGDTNQFASERCFHSMYDNICLHRFTHRAGESTAKFIINTLSVVHTTTAFSCFLKIITALKSHILGHEA